MGLLSGAGSALLGAPALNFYNHDGWRLAFRHRPAAKGREQDAPLLLIHPVGVGLSAWFWERMMDCWDGGAVYAPDLIGCGASDEWAPDERGIFLPLDWSRGVEALWRQHVRRPCVVVAQGGLAPVGVQLAAREADDWSGAAAVSRLVLAAPPTWADMTTAVPEADLRRNYDALRSPLGDAALGTIESRWAIRTFSDLFLFEGESDEAWLEAAVAGCGKPRRAPIQAFNAGLLQARSFEPELTSLRQPTLVLAGRGDKRQRQEYAAGVRTCRLETIRGANVLPWEAPAETCATIAKFCAEEGGG